MPISVTVWNEFRHEKSNDLVKSIYPDGIHNAIATALNLNPEINAFTATLDELENGLPDDVMFIMKFIE